MIYSCEAISSSHHQSVEYIEILLRQRTNGCVSLLFLLLSQSTKDNRLVLHCSTDINGNSNSNVFARLNRSHKIFLNNHLNTSSMKGFTSRRIICIILYSNGRQQRPTRHWPSIPIQAKHHYIVQ